MSRVVKRGRKLVIWRRYSWIWVYLVLFVNFVNMDYICELNDKVIFYWELFISLYMFNILNIECRCRKYKIVIGKFLKDLGYRMFNICFFIIF